MKGTIKGENLLHSQRDVKLQHLCSSVEAIHSSLQVNPINDEVPVLVTGLTPVLSCAEGQEAVITAEFICATDADSDNNSLAFFIVRQPHHGVVLRDGVIIDCFIQADVSAGIISYRHTGGQRGMG